MRTKYPYEEFHARLLRDCNGFFTCYSGAGGDPDNVIVLLWYLTPESQRERIPQPHYPALAQGFKGKLRELEGACAALLRYFPKNPTGPIRKLQKTVEATQEASRQVRRSDAAMRSFVKAWGIAGKRGRPTGPLDDTVILATLERECRIRFGRPYHRQLLELAEAAKGAPVLALRTDQGHDHSVRTLRLRLQTVSPAEIEATHRRFFPSEQ